jgi:isocitrate dehydrogenase
MATKPTIAIAKGDGIGPEIMDAVLRILDAAGAQLNYETVKIGKDVYLDGHSSGIAPDAWDILRKHKVFLKSPITTPQGGGYKSLNVTVRKTLGLFANVRPSKAYTPFVPSFFPKLDLVIIRENEEDLYAGIEHQHTDEVVQCLKLISRPGCERIVRYAFDYARTNNRKKVTCMSKDNIMKLTDGLFHSVFNEIAAEYPEISTDHYIIDIGAAMLADQPERFDVIVTLNLYGDIISDITAQVAGSVGLGGSSNVGEEVAMFEAIHGSAPDIAGKGIANPSGLLNGACMMLYHLGQSDVAAKIENALHKTLEDGIHTGDIYTAEHSTARVGTEAFADAVIARLGQVPTTIATIVPNPDAKPIEIKPYVFKPAGDKRLMGVDVFIQWAEGDRNPNVLGQIVDKFGSDDLHLTLMSNRGQAVYPNGQSSTFCTDHWRCRYKVQDEKTGSINQNDIIQLMQQFVSAGLDIIKTENLYYFNGIKAFSAGQGQ